MNGLWPCVTWIPRCISLAIGSAGIFSTATLGLAADRPAAKLQAAATAEIEPAFGEVSHSDPQRALIGARARGKLQEAEALVKNEKFAEVTGLLEDAGKLYRDAALLDDEIQLRINCALGRTELALRKYPDARQAYLVALECAERRFGKASREHGRVLCDLGIVEKGAEKNEPAIAYFTAALETLRQHPRDSSIRSALRNLGELRLAQKRHPEAAECFQELCDLLARDGGVGADGEERAAALESLADLRYELKDYGRCRAAYEEAVACLTRVPAAKEWQRDSVRRKLDDVVCLLDENESRRHLRQEFERLVVRAEELRDEAKTKPDFRELRYLPTYLYRSNASEPQPLREPEPSDPFGERFERRLFSARFDAGRLPEGNNAALANITSVAAKIEAADGRHAAAREYLMRARRYSSSGGYFLEDTARLNLALAAAEDHLGRYEATLDATDEAYAILATGPNDWQICAVISRCQAAGSACREAALRERCLRYLKLVERIVVEDWDSQPAMMAEVHLAYSYYYLQTNDKACIRHAEEYLALLKRLLTPEAPQFAYAEIRLAECCLICGDIERGETLARSALAKLRAAAPLDHEYIVRVQWGIAQFDAARGRTEAARLGYDRALSTLLKHKADHERVASLRREREEFLAGRPVPLAKSGISGE